jgi:hypothetical protein
MLEGWLVEAIEQVLQRTAEPPAPLVIGEAGHRVQTGLASLGAGNPGHRVVSRYR